MLGAFLALCSAASFAFNNASVRRAVLTGSIVQGMAITVPLGVPLFFIGALLTGNLGAVLGFSPTALAALAAPASCISSGAATATTAPPARSAPISSRRSSSSIC